MALFLILSFILTVPYVGWGVYLLRRRFYYHDEIPPLVEGATVIAVGILYFVEYSMMRTWAQANVVFMLFALLGLAVSGAALYGPTLTSLLAFVLVDSFVMPQSHERFHVPHYGPAEALERQGDFEGAVQEYMVIARIFPKDPTAAIRIGDNLVKLGQTVEAAPWFEKGLALLSSPEKSLPLTNRLYEVYARELAQPDEGRRVLEDYVERYADSEFAGTVRKRIERLESQEKHDATPADASLPDGPGRVLPGAEHDDIDEGPGTPLPTRKPHDEKANGGISLDRRSSDELEDISSLDTDENPEDNEKKGEGLELDRSPHVTLDGDDEQ